MLKSAVGLTLASLKVMSFPPSISLCLVFSFIIMCLYMVLEYVVGCITLWKSLSFISSYTVSALMEKNLRFFSLLTFHVLVWIFPSDLSSSSLIHYLICCKTHSLRSNFSNYIFSFRISTSFFCSFHFYAGICHFIPYKIIVVLMIVILKYTSNSNI